MHDHRTFKKRVQGEHCSVNLSHVNEEHVTWGEIWVYHYQPESKHDSIQ